MKRGCFNYQWYQSISITILTLRTIVVG